MKIIDTIAANKASGKKMLAVLIDPDKINNDERLQVFLNRCESAKVDLIFAGGSLLVESEIDDLLLKVRKKSKIPIVIFPGDSMQVSKNADAILLLSLISGRNADLLIGQHVKSAPRLKKSGLEILPTGYMLIDCGNITTASYISQTIPIPHDKPEIAAITALAGEMLGLKMIYADGGSGAMKPVSAETIFSIRQSTEIPLIIGGGIRSLGDAKKAWDAGADIVVMGTAFENDEKLIDTFRERL